MSRAPEAILRGYTLETVPTGEFKRGECPSQGVDAQSGEGGEDKYLPFRWTGSVVMASLVTFLHLNRKFLR